MDLTAAAIICQLKKCEFLEERILAICPLVSGNLKKGKKEMESKGNKRLHSQDSSSCTVIVMLFETSNLSYCFTTLYPIAM
jgi:hypothetical protein